MIIVVVAVVVPVALTVTKSHNNSSSAADHGGSSSGGNSGGGSTSNGDDGLGPVNGNVISGGDGSTVTMESGDTFTYTNKFGGFWVQDPNDPYNNNAQAQSWSPPLNQSWDWQNNKIRG